MRTNSNAYLANFASYAKQSLYSEATGAELPDLLAYAVRRYASEYGDANKRRHYPNQQERLAQYLMGMPFHFAFYNDDIVATYERLHGEPCPANKRESIVQGWWLHLSIMLERLARTHGLSFYNA